MRREPIQSADAPKAVGAYSQGIRTGNLLFLSGQIPLDPTSGEMVGGGDVRLEAERVLTNIEALLKAGGCAFADVVKATIFLADMSDFAVVNEIYARRFEGVVPPARSTVQVAALPRGARVEIEITARVP